MRRSSLIKAVRQIVPTMTQEQLAGFVLSFAENLNGQLADTYLEELTVQQKTRHSSNKNRVQKKETNPLKLLEQLIPRIEKIEDEELSLDSEYNPMWDEWGDDDEENEFCFEDNEGIFPIIEQACKVVSMLLEQKYYRECAQLVKRLLEMSISVDGDYYDDTISLAQLDEEDVLDIDYHQLLLDGLYALYQQPELNGQLEQFFDIMARSECRHLTLTGVLQDREKNANQLFMFLEKWIPFLGKREGQRAAELLKEAIPLSHPTDGGLEIVERYAKVHPSLYVWLLEMGNQHYTHEKLVSIGETALSKLPYNYLVREKVALLTAEYALCLGRMETVEKLWLEAFRSNPTPENLLRLISEAQNYTLWQNEVNAILSTPRKVKSFSSWETIEYNEHSVTGLYQKETLYFLSGKAANVLEKNLNCTQYLGWSEGFMKKGFDLFLLALCDAENPSNAFQKICAHLQDEIGFNEKEYGMGLNLIHNEKSELILWNGIQKWKQYFPIDDELKEAALKKLDVLLAKRTKAIVGGGKRAYYGECAMWIAALGEIREQYGEPHAKQKLMESYQLTYPRHYAFRGELEQLGYKYQKKK